MCVLEAVNEDKDEPKRAVPDIEDAVDANGKLLNQQRHATRSYILKCLSSWERAWLLGK
jgi:hypothetical protein